MRRWHLPALLRPSCLSRWRWRPRWHRMPRRKGMHLFISSDLLSRSLLHHWYLSIPADCLPSLRPMLSVFLSGLKLKVSNFSPQSTSLIERHSNLKDDADTDAYNEAVQCSRMTSARLKDTAARSQTLCGLHVRETFTCDRKTGPCAGRSRSSCVGCLQEVHRVWSSASWRRYELVVFREICRGF